MKGVGFHIITKDRPNIVLVLKSDFSSFLFLFVNLGHYGGGLGYGVALSVSSKCVYVFFAGAGGGVLK